MATQKTKWETAGHGRVETSVDSAGCRDSEYVEISAGEGRTHNLGRREVDWNLYMDFPVYKRWIKCSMML